MTETVIIFSTIFLKNGRIYTPIWSDMIKAGGSMQKLILVGAGGCMREFFWQINEYNKTNPTWVVEGYVDLAEDLNMENLGICPYLGDEQYLLTVKEPVNVAICIANPQKRAELVKMYMQNPNIRFPNVVLSRSNMAPDVSMGQGVIISRNCTLSANVHLGDFVFLNMESMIAHDSIVGDFSTLSYRATVAGNVKVGEGCYLGISSTCVQGIELGDGVTVAGGVVVKKDVLPGEEVV